jgi:cation/acetate symporter
MNLTLVAMFALFVAITLGITHWAARKSGSRKQFYAAGGSLTGLQNGLAFSGEMLSAATFLGITALYFTSGYDGLIYSIGALMGWPVLLFLMSERCRKLGRFTLTDVVTHRFKNDFLRLFSACATIAITTGYMIAQLVGAGGLISLLLGLDFSVSVVLTGALMIIYVIFGGMVATSWVQIVKACFLLTIGLLLTVWVLATFNFSFAALLTTAIAKHPHGAGILAPSSLITSFGAAASVTVTQIVGLAGLPHFLMRFNTVSNAFESRRSASYATLFIGLFYGVMIVIGYGTVAIIGNDPTFVESPGLLRNGNNMAVLDMAKALGGNLLLAICAAAAFATILAVVAGLTLAVAASVSHDIYGMIVRREKQTEAEEIKVARIAAVIFGIVTIGLSIAFKNENITFLVVTALSIAASSTFPVLFLTCFWSPLTAAGAWIGGTCGLIASVAGIVLGPMVWVSVLGHAQTVYPYQYPTLVSLPIAMIVAVGISLLAKRPDPVALA